MATPNTDYNKYTNDELKQMIDELVKNNLITSQLEAKFTDAIFKRHHDKPFNDDDTRKINHLMMMTQGRLHNEETHYNIITERN